MAYTVDRTGAYEGDLCLPTAGAGAQGFPVVVLVHGGSWRTGSKHEMKRIAQQLAERGYASFAINYDKHRHSFPQSWIETREAVRFVRLRSIMYHLDPDRVAVLGSSAGAEIVALTALEPTGPADPPMRITHDDVPVQAAVVLNGGYDLHPKAWLLKRYMGGDCEHIGKVCDDASPDNHVGDHEVPFFVGHGDSDHQIPYSQATTFIELMQKNGNQVTTFVARGGGHNYWKKSRYRAANFEALVVFLDTNLKAR